MIRPVLLLAVSPVFLAAMAGGCGDDEGSGLQEPTPVASISVTAPTTRISVGETVQLTATARDADGNPLEDREFTWSSGIGTVASVSADGLVTGRVKGASEIRATTEEVTGTLVITVDPIRGDPSPLAWRAITSSAPAPAANRRGLLY